MTGRLALRALTTRPVRSAVLAAGFGFGIAVMAALLGVGEVILEQARAPALAGGGDLIVGGATGRVPSARFVLAHVLGESSFAPRVTAASPSSSALLHWMREDGSSVPIDARGGVPSLTRALGDPETATLAAWTDTVADAAWSAPAPSSVLRAMDRFHPVPRGTPWDRSWAEWLYFNGTADTTRFYLTFLVGPESADGRREAGVRLQLERDGLRSEWSAQSEVDGKRIVDTAPDLEIAGNRVRLDGLMYRIELDLEGGEGRRIRGEIALEAVPGRALAPLALRGARGWLSGYVVPVLSGALSGSLVVRGETLSLSGGIGYHDHNWGFWEGVTWQWGQVASGDLSLVFGRVRPPLEAADPARVPGFLVVLGPTGPLGHATDVTIEEHGAGGAPERIVVRARGAELDLTLDAAVESQTRSRFGASSLDFVQMRAAFAVRGTGGGRRIDFAAQGSAETFRGSGGE